jgi:hypothetical protein
VIEYEEVENHVSYFQAEEETFVGLTANSVQRTNSPPPGRISEAVSSGSDGGTLVSFLVQVMVGIWHEAKWVTEISLYWEAQKPTGGPNA